MEKLKREVARLTTEETRDAVKKHGLFHSNHEGVALMEEEIYEAIDEINATIRNFKKLKTCVYRDVTLTSETTAESICEHAILGACELIQVAAMASKYRMLRADRVNADAD